MNGKAMTTRKATPQGALALALAVLCAGFLAAGAFAQQAWADLVSYPMKQIYSGTKGLVINHPYLEGYYAFSAYNAGKVSAIKVANPKVIGVESRNDGKYALLYISIKKTGTTKLTYKLGSKKHTVTINAVKYQNPFATFKLGSKNYKAKFKRDLWGEAKLGEMAGKLTVKPAKNWKVTKITVNDNGKKRTVKNGAKLKKASKYRIIYVSVKNTKTGVSDEYTLASA